VCIESVFSVYCECIVLRVMRVCVCHRRDFVTFLNRPDHKQQFVSQWQKVGIQ